MPPREGYARCVAGTQGFALGYFRSRLWRDNSNEAVFHFYVNIAAKPAPIRATITPITAV